MAAIEVTCNYCSKTFNITKQRLKNTNICCSRDCASNLKKSFTTPNTECFSCGKSFYLKPSHKAKRLNPCCSSICMGKMRSKIYVGENNHQFGLKGELNSTFISDIKITTHGYISVRNLSHPFRNKNDTVLFHRLIMEEYLKSSNDYKYLINVEGIWVLNPAFVVHHIDENKLNNSLNNLEIMLVEEHISLHSKENYKDRNIDHLGRLLPKGTIKKGNLFKANSLDAGLDIVSNESSLIQAKNSKLVSTDLFINVPKDHVGLLWSRSGLSVKHKIEVGAGCIDSGYNGEIKVHLYNHGNEDYTVNIGDRIAQLLTIPINPNLYDKVEEFDETTTRGTGGFGSSGR